MTEQKKPLAELHVNTEQRKLQASTDQNSAPLTPEAVWALLSKADIGIGAKKVGANDSLITQEEISAAANAIPFEEHKQLKEVAALFAYEGNLEGKPKYPVTKDMVDKISTEVVYDKKEIDKLKEKGASVIGSSGYTVYRTDKSSGALTKDEQKLKISAWEARIDQVDANSDDKITYLEMLQNNGPNCVIVMPESSHTQPTPEEVEQGKELIEARGFANMMWKKALSELDTDRDGNISKAESDAAQGVAAKAVSKRFIDDVKTFRAELDENAPVTKKEAYAVSQAVIYTKDEVTAFSEQVKAGQADIISKVKSGALVLENREQAVADINAGQQLVQALDTLKNGAGVTYAEAAKLTKGNGTSLVAPAPAVKQAGEDGITSAAPVK